MQFPTGGKAREPKGMIRCDSGADSTVWMEEENGGIFLRRSALESFVFRSFFIGSENTYKIPAAAHALTEIPETVFRQGFFRRKEEK